MSCNSNKDLYNKGKISKGNLYQYDKESSMISIKIQNLKIQQLQLDTTYQEILKLIEDSKAKK